MRSSPVSGRNAISSPPTETGSTGAGNDTRTSAISDRTFLVLWDGDCALCARCVEWARGRDRRNRLKFVPWQEAPTPPMDEALAARAQRSVQVLLPGGRLEGGRAVLHILGELGYRLPARILSLPPLVWLVEAGYRGVARHRGFIGSRVLRLPAARCGTKEPPER